MKTHIWKGILRPSPARQNARARGENKYKGKPCPYGHDGTRYTQTARCVDCVSVYYSEYSKYSKYKGANKT